MLPVVFCIKSVLSILLTEMLSIKTSEGFILRTDTMAMVRRQIDLDGFTIIDKLTNNENDKLLNFSRLEVICRNPSENELNKQLSEAYSNIIEKVIF